MHVRLRRSLGCVVLLAAGQVEAISPREGLLARERRGGRCARGAGALRAPGTPTAANSACLKPRVPQALRDSVCVCRKRRKKKMHTALKLLCRYSSLTFLFT